MPDLASWLITRPEVTCVQFAGDDLLTMLAPALRAYLGPLLQLAQLESIRVDTTALGYWPHRFLHDPDADDTLRLFGQVTASGKTLALTARFAPLGSLNRAWPVTPSAGSAAPAR